VFVVKPIVVLELTFVKRSLLFLYMVAEEK
jgi:hypothetical protein